MASHAQKGGVSLDAYQWPGGTATTTSFTAGSGVATWLKRLALHTPGDGTLQVPTATGVSTARPTDWVVQNPDGTVGVLTAVHFASLYA